MPETTLYIRVKQALTWLKRNKGILQKDIAEEMGITETSFTRGIARIKDKNDEDFVISFHSAVSKLISLDYLLHGEGSLAISEESSEKDTDQQQPAYYADKLIESLEKQIKEKDEQLADKERIIKLLEQKIEMLEAMQHIDSDNQLLNYPFAIGAADQSDIKAQNVSPFKNQK